MTPTELAGAARKPATPERFRKMLRHIPSWAFWRDVLRAMPTAARSEWADGMAPLLIGKLGAEQ